MLLHGAIVFGALVFSTEACTSSCAADGQLTPIIYDHDANIDDMVALPYLVKAGAFDLKAVIYTATGFTSSVIGLRNTVKVLEMLCMSHVDVGRSSLDGAFQSGKFPPGCDYAKYVPRTSIHDSDNLYGVIDDFLPYSSRASGKFMSAADVYKKHVDAGVTTVLAIGPLTSLWDFKQKYPDSFAKLKTLYCMFGTFNARGNVFTAPGVPIEFNAVGDPHAAKEVLSADTLDDITLVPLDATNDVPMTPDYMKELETLTTPEGAFVSKLTHGVQAGWFAGEYGFYGWVNSSGIVTDHSEADGYFFWDPLAVALMIDPSLAEMKTAKVIVVASDPPQANDGQTKVDDAGKLMKYADIVSEANAEKIRKDIKNALSKECLQDQPLSISATVKVAESMSTCGSLKAMYKEQACCKNPGKRLMSKTP